MLIELNTLPPIIAEQILTVQTGNTVQFTNNGEVIATLTKAMKQPSYAKGDFDYDLEQMKKAVEAPYVTVPDFNTVEELLAWMENLSDDDFVAETRFSEQT